MTPIQDISQPPPEQPARPHQELGRVCDYKLGWIRCLGSGVRGCVRVRVCVCVEAVYIGEKENGKTELQCIWCSL